MLVICTRSSNRNNIEFGINYLNLPYSSCLPAVSVSCLHVCTSRVVGYYQCRVCVHVPSLSSFFYITIIVQSSMMSFMTGVHRFGYAPFKYFTSQGIPGPKPKPFIGSLDLIKKFNVCYLCYSEYRLTAICTILCTYRICY